MLRIVTCLLLSFVTLNVRANCPGALDPGGRSFVVTFERPDPGQRLSEEKLTADLDAFITRDLEPFLRRSFPDVATFEYSRFPFVNSVLVVFPPGTRPSRSAIAKFERTSLTTAVRAVVTPNGPSDWFAK